MHARRSSDAADSCPGRWARRRNRGVRLLSASDMFSCLLKLLVRTCIALFFTHGVSFAQSDPDWSGRWETVWRDGAAVVELQQVGSTVTGMYEPGDGQIEGQVDGRVLRGRWAVDGVSGALIFAISDDGQTFAGRFDTGEYWNGRRLDPADAGGRSITRDGSPRETLQSIVASVNDFMIGGDVEALRFAQTLLEFDGDETGSRALNHRRSMLWDILDLSTFRIYDAPRGDESSTAAFTIALDGTDASYDLRFVRSGEGGWRLLVEDEATLAGALAGYLDALDATNVAAGKAATLGSPRGVMQRFLFGIADWTGTGREAALSTLDLSWLPEHLHAAEGPLLADYLKNVIDRAGFVFFQEIPNNPNRTTPYVHYAHPVGDIVIRRLPGGTDGAPDRWAFGAETLRNLPELYSAMQHLPLAEGIPPGAPLTRFFSVREHIRDVAPTMLNRAFILEHWQWLGILLFLAAAFVVIALIGRLAGLPSPGTDDGAFEDDAGRPNRGLVQAAQLAFGSLALTWGLGGIGIIETPLAVLHTITSATAAIGATWFAILLTGAVGAVFQRKAAATAGYADEIVTAMGVGIVKLVVLAVGLLLLAEIVDLPYEGVLAGLGVGGLALAFAARETVSNVLGGVLLLTDRPFRRGDLVETGGQLATVETVGIRSTRLKRLDDTVMIIPNAQLSDQVIVNWGLRSRRRVDLAIGLTFDTPRAELDRFQSELRDVILRQPGVDGEDIYVGLKDFGVSAIEVECRCFFRVSSYEEQVAARAALVADILELADHVGVNFAFPTRTVHLVQEND